MRTTLLFLALLFVPTVALAQTPSAKTKAQALLKEGLDFYDHGEHAAALQKFQAAYTAFPSPKLLFNVGQANRDLGRRAEALDAFERFLTEATDASPETVAEARRSVAELRTQTRFAPEPTPPSQRQGVPDARRVDRSPDATGNRAVHQLRWVGVGVTTALAGAAIVAGLSTNARFRDLRDSCGQTEQGCSAAQVDGLQSKARMTNILLVLTTLAGVATGVLFYIDHGEGGLTVARRF